MFCRLQPKITEELEGVKGKRWHIACVVFGIFMAVNLSLTAFSIARWSERHYGIEASTKVQAFFDENAPDDWMQSRFVEWEFLDNLVPDKN